MEIIKELSSNIPGKVEIGGLLNQKIEITKGLKQECSLSSLIFNILYAKRCFS